MKIVRSIIGIVVGAGMVIVLAGVADFIGGTLFGSMPDPETGKVPAEANITGMCVWNAGWYFVITLLAAFVAVHIAGRARMLHAAILASLIVALGVAFFFVGPATFEQLGVELPPWYLPALPVLGCAGALTGGWVSPRRGLPAA